MWDLVNLKGVCTRAVVHLPVLERIGASNCSLLVKLPPITTNNAEDIKEIRAKLEWAEEPETPQRSW
uniref:Uncharacterized protein n=1 Tax=Salix viminalis TaxID=40686 RepID=A0A6N2MEB1_SALVM